MARLTAAQRKALPSSIFAIPGQRAYPIPDKSHAQNALARASQYGTPEVKAAVRKKVAAKYPDMAKKKPAMSDYEGSAADKRADAKSGAPEGSAADMKQDKAGLARMRAGR